MATKPRLKPWQMFVMARADNSGGYHGLSGYLGNKCVVVDTPMYPPRWVPGRGYEMYGVLLEDWEAKKDRIKNDPMGYSFYFYDTMADPIGGCNPGEMMIRVVQRDGFTYEAGIPPKEYETLDTCGIAERVIGKKVNVVGQKSLIETPDATLLTIGIAE